MARDQRKNRSHVLCNDGAYLVSCRSGPLLLGTADGGLICLVPIVALGFGIAQHFVLLFKGTVVLPSDLLVLGAAAEVSGGYNFILTERMIISIGSLAACFCVLAFIGHRTESQRRFLPGALGAVVINLVVSSALVFGVYSLYNNVKVEDVLATPINRWMPLDTYQTEGFTFGFIAMMQDLPIPVPEGYSDSAAQALQDELANEFDREMNSPERQAVSTRFEETEPSVVVVMNESFADLSLHDAIKEAGYEGPQFFKSLSDTLQRGTFMTSVVGGATANTEFEFLTGTSTGFLGSYKYPYQLYNFSNVDSLPKQFKEWGYDTTAMHPMNGANYNRSTNYKRLGFDTFLDIEDFPGAHTYHAGVDDRTTYDRIIEILQSSDTPQFIFDVTMQNHGGYAGGTVPDEDLVDWAPADLLGGDLAVQLNTYLTCIEESDAALEHFIAQLRELKRPTVLVFFGDHQPNISALLNDALHPGEEAFAHEMRTYESAYFVWTNYAIADRSEGAPQETSAAQLAAEALYEIGAPLTDFQKAQLVLGRDIPSVNFIGYRGADGLRYALADDGPFKATLNQLQTIQYLNFARRV